MTKTKIDLLVTNIVNVVLFVIIFVFGYMRWQKLQDVIVESNTSQTQYRNIHSALKSSRQLDHLGERVYEWLPSDSTEYQRQLAKTNAILGELKGYYPQTQIDSMQFYLGEKGRLLTRIYENVVKRNESDEHLREERQVTVRDTETYIKHYTGNIVRKSREETSSQSKERTVVVPSINEMALIDKTLCDINLSQLNDSLGEVNLWLDENMNQILDADDDKAERVQTETTEKASGIGQTTFIGGMTLLFLVLAVNLGNTWRRSRTMKKLEKEAEKNRKMVENRRKVMYSIVHDLRSPLGLIIGYNDMEKRSPAKNDKYIDEVSFASAQMKGMIDQLLDYFRLESDKMELNQRNFNLIEMQKELAGSFELTAQQKMITFAKPMLQDVMLYGDYDKIKHIATNLLDNAFKFTEKGSVCLNLLYKSGMLMIEVIDTGIGIRQEDQDRIFEEFTRLPNGVAKGMDGLGIGLSIVKMLTDLMGGVVTMRSEIGGTGFYVALPIQEAVKETVEDGMEKAVVNIQNSVLVVDDNDHWLDMVKLMLEENGMICDTCNNTEDFFPMIRAKEYSLVIVDMKMPGKTGKELLDLMREASVGNSQSVPVVVSTSSGEETEQAMIDAGFDGCLFKDFTSSKLIDMVNRLIQEKTGTLTPDYTRMRKSTVDSLIEDTESSMEKIHQFTKERNFERVYWWAHHLRSSWALYRVGVLLDPIIKIAIRKDENGWQDLEESVREADAVAEMLLAKAREIKAE